MGTLRSVRSRGKKKGFLGIRFAEPHAAVYTDHSIDAPEGQTEQFVADAVEQSYAASETLPTIGYASFTEETEYASELTDLENQAHAQRVLLSSDAMRYFAAKVEDREEREAVLSAVIAKARVSYPSEDGWVVVNLSRIETLLEEVQREAHEAVSDAPVALNAVQAPLTSGSLAEAMITGNVKAAYELIAQRPMIALADASADFDALYRFKNGQTVEISEMLKEGAADITPQQLKEAIATLTGALDGTYTDEMSAVRVAIMKAIQALQ